MKKFFFLVVGAIAAIVALSMLGPLVGFGFSALLVYLGMHYYVKTNSKFGKVFWVVLGLIGIFTAISNIPALVGLAAIFTVYVLYKSGTMKRFHLANQKLSKKTIHSQTLKWNGQS